MALVQLRKESQSIFNRIRSIAEDAEFVRHVHVHYHHLPLLPNMRCGAWYTDPAIVVSTERAYFKSTDGHTNNWSFNLRRPNLHILPLITAHGGLVLVDSTRAGKRIPDALSKTIPIWCAVINRAILLQRGTAGPWDTALYTPPGSVSPQEHSRIEAKLDRWASELAASSYRLPSLDHPLRPIWITPATTVFPSLTHRTFYPIVCVSASKQVTDATERRASGFAYIQGSGDDHELWSMGLTPTLFWKHHEQILAATSCDLPDLVQSIVSIATSNIDDTNTDPAQSSSMRGTPIQHVSGRITICSVASVRRSLGFLQVHPDVALVCLVARDSVGTVSKEDSSRLLCIQTPPGKKGQHHFLTVVLPLSIPFVRHHLQHDRTVCIACDTGTDTSVGVALVSLALLFHSDGTFRSQDDARELSKDVLKTRLQWIISSCPQANPSRATLKRVNDFLLSPFSSSSSLDGTTVSNK